MRPKLNAATRTSDVLPLPGSFDFADPQSALALAHFVSSLSYQCDILQEERGVYASSHGDPMMMPHRGLGVLKNGVPISMGQTSRGMSLVNAVFAVNVD